MVVVLGVFASLNLFVGLVEFGPEHGKFARLGFTEFFRDEKLLESNAKQRGRVRKPPCFEFSLKKFLCF